MNDTPTPQPLNAQEELELIQILMMRANMPYLHTLGPKNPLVANPPDTLHLQRGMEPQQMAVMEAFAQRLANRVHADNVARGWWTNPETGEFLVDRHVGDMLMLVITALAGAFDAFDTCAADDKVPQFPGVTVELADAVIRVLDTAGRHCPLFGQEFAIESAKTQTFLKSKRHFMEGCVIVASAMEAHRKRQPFDTELARFVGWALRMSHAMGLQFCEAFLAKYAYNAERADHKLENRRLDGGKKS